MKAYTKKNHLGHWVGCLDYGFGKTSIVTNAKDHEWQAREIAERMLAGAMRVEEESKRFKRIRY